MSNINDKLLSGYVYTPSQNYIAMSLMALNQFWVKANSTDLINSLTKGFTQPLDYVNFIRVYPFNIMGDTYEETDVPVPIANKFVNVPNNRTDALLKTSHIGNALSKIHKTYTFTFDNITKFEQLEPYTTIDCYLAYVGFVSLSPSEIYGTITVDLLIDVISGNGTYTISRGNYVIYTTQTNFSVDIALGGTNNIEQFKAKFNNGVNTLMGIGTTALGLYMGNRFLTSHGIDETLSSITNIPNSNTSYAIKRGTLGNYSTNFFNPHSIYFIIKTKKVNDYDSFKSVYGKPLNQSVNLSTLEGITYIPNPKLEVPNITSQEYDTLVGLMQNGIILKNTTKSLYVNNVKLSGNYTQHKIDISNVYLSGNYQDKHTLTIESANINGTYTSKPQLEISNVSLSGTYEYTPQLDISNVKLRGSYYYKDDVTLSVSNVKLSGTYDYIPQLDISNVSLSGTYSLVADTSLSVSNVSLNGNYSIKEDSALSVSNVILSGKYEEYVEPTPTTYTIITKLYKDNVLYNTIYLTYTSGDTCSPSNLATRYQPSGYDIDRTSPTSSFIVTSSRTVYIYYVTPSTIYYDLTMYLYKDNILYKTITNSYEAYTTINPSTLASNNCPSGYSVSSYNPSSSFTMNSDKELYIYYSEIKPLTYTLTIQLIKDYSLYDTITQTITSGTTINPSTIASNYCPSGYTIKSYTPTSSFTMTSDATVTCEYETPTLSAPSITYSQGTGTYKTKYKVTLYNYNSTNAKIHYSGSDIEDYSVNVGAGSFTYFYVEYLSLEDRTYSAYFTKDGYNDSNIAYLTIPANS